MTSDPKSDVINRQYERVDLPAAHHPDIPEWLKNNWQWYDPSHASPIPSGSARFRPFGPGWTSRSSGRGDQPGRGLRPHQPGLQ